MKHHCLNNRNSLSGLAHESRGVLSALQKVLCAILLFLLCLPALVPADGHCASLGGGGLPSVWQPLLEKFVHDGVNAEEARKLLSTLPARATPDPMGKKALELYRREFMPGTLKKVKADTWYKGVVTEANAQLCRQYIAEHKAAFAEAQSRYEVPPSIAAALLFVETRLGRVLADVPENAFYVLASMAVSTSPESLGAWLQKMPNHQKHLPWLDATLKKRSNWAYNEVLALTRHMIKDRIEPNRLPSSIYGAVGLCQFMPSNISVYGADGDGDGRVDLFTPDDAIASLANYLAKHGWKADMSAQGRHKCLMSYNHSKVYANTILALANLVEGREPLSGAPAGARRKK